MKPGDVIDAEIEGIGFLRNRVIRWEDRYGSPPPAVRANAQAGFSHVVTSPISSIKPPRF